MKHYFFLFVLEDQLMHFPMVISKKLIPFRSTLIIAFKFVLNFRQMFLNFVSQKLLNSAERAKKTQQREQLMSNNMCVNGR